MSFPDPDAFRQAATTLYNQRGQLHKAEVADSDHLARLEEQLRYQLHYLATQPALEEPGNEAAWFVTLAAGLMAADQARQLATMRQAIGLLSNNELGSKGAFDALALTRPEDSNQALVELYKENAELRPTLFALWKEQNAQLPPALTNLAELQGRDTSLQRAALAYAAANTKIGLDLFRAYYRPLLAAHGGQRLESKVTDIAIWGGMVRGDQDAHLALRHALELEDNPQYQAALLRLSALNASPDILPVIKQHLASNPQQGSWLLALHGSAEAISILLETLEQPATANHAARAWHWVSGQTLPQKPRLSVVSVEQDSPSAGTLPDSRMAKSWWQDAQAQAGPKQRWLAGRCHDTLALIEKSWHLAGKQGQDALDLLALATGKPLPIATNSEQRRRRHYLTNLLKQPALTAQRGHAHV